MKLNIFEKKKQFLKNSSKILGLSWSPNFFLYALEIFIATIKARFNEFISGVLLQFKKLIFSSFFDKKSNFEKFIKNFGGELESKFFFHTFKILILTFQHKK